MLQITCHSLGTLVMFLHWGPDASDFASALASFAAPPVYLCVNFSILSAASFYVSTSRQKRANLCCTRAVIYSSRVEWPEAKAASDT